MCNFKNLFVPLSVAPAPPVYAKCSQTYVKLSKRVQNTKRNRRFQYRTIVLLAQVA